MFDLGKWRARRAEKRAAKIAALGDRTARKAAKESERIANQGREARDPGPWTGVGA